MTTTRIIQQRIGPMQNFGYLIIDLATGDAAVVDPSFDARPLQREAAAHGARITLILNTHGHRDHIDDNQRLQAETGARIAAHTSARQVVDLRLADGDRLPLGQSVLEVLHTPGHCPDACCFCVGEALFTGDTLFVGECGRVDLPESDVDAMHQSLIVRLRGLDDGLTVYPGHDYGPTPSARLGDEKATNYTLAVRDREAFRRFMTGT